MYDEQDTGTAAGYSSFAHGNSLNAMMDFNKSKSTFSKNKTSKHKTKSNLAFQKLNDSY
jgi:hypothetical protein